MLLKIIKFLWYLSFPVFLGLAIYIYIYLPDAVSFSVGEAGFGPTISKSVFFYALIGVMIFINFAFNFIGNMIAYLPRPLVLVPKRSQWTQTVRTRKKLAAEMKNWFRGILLFVNAFLILVGANIYVLNTPDTIINVQNYFIVVAIFVGLWLAYYPLAFMDAPEA